MDKNELPSLLSWTYYNDSDESVPPPAPKPSQAPTDRHLYDYDKLIAESTGLYKDWWILWKRIHPEWALFPEEPKEPEVIIPPKPKVTFEKLSCKRCNHTWIPRSKEPPVQCPKCHSPYWNREKKRS